MTIPEGGWKYLERDPHSSYKQLSIKGRRIRARILYGMYVSETSPMTVEEISADYDLPVEAVREAIAYVESNPPEIERDWLLEEALIEAHGMNHPDYKWNPKKYYKPLTPQERLEIERKFS